jgi:hypothetical protein
LKAGGQATRRTAIENQGDLQSAALRPTLQSPTANTTNFEPMNCLIFAHQTSRNPGEVGMNLAKISDSKTPESEHWRGFAARSVVGLLIRRSLVRAQVGEPYKTTG